MSHPIEEELRLRGTKLLEADAFRRIYVVLGSREHPSSSSYRERIYAAVAEGWDPPADVILSRWP